MSERDASTALLKEIEALQLKLAPYVEHDTSCPRFPGPYGRCDCGLAAFFHNARTEADSAFAPLLALLSAQAPLWKRVCHALGRFTEMGRAPRA